MSHRNRGGGTYVLLPARGDCPTGKVQFATRKQARAATKRMRETTLSVFRCERCDLFHLGHLPRRVRNGDIDKADWLEATQGEIA